MRKLTIICIVLIALFAITAAATQERAIREQSQTEDDQTKSLLVSLLEKAKSLGASTKQIDQQISKHNIDITNLGDLKKAEQLLAKHELQIKQYHQSYAENNEYIVEFTEPPLVKRQAEKTENRAPRFQVQSSRSKLGSAKLDQHKNQIRAQQQQFKESLGTKPNFFQRFFTNAKVTPIATDAEFSTVLNAVKVTLTQEQVDLARELDYVKAVHPNNKVQTTLSTSVPAIKGDTAQQLTDTNGNNLLGSGVTIAIIDTGVDYTHPDLGGCFGAGCRVVGGYDFVNNDIDPMDDNGHGTHVAGAAAAKGTVNGVAPNATIYAYKVLDSLGGGTFADIIAAVERSVDPNNDSDTSDHHDIISMSLGGSGNPFDAVSTAVDNAVEAGVVAVVAAGNSGPGNFTIDSPGAAKHAITVGASCQDHQLNLILNCQDRDFVKVAEFSSRGFGVIYDKPDVLAPGVQINSTVPAGSCETCSTSRYLAISGTSMATPQVAGAAALILQKNPTWSPFEVKAALKNKATTFNYPRQIQGAGIIDAHASASQSIPPPSGGMFTVSNLNLITIEG